MREAKKKEPLWGLLLLDLLDFVEVKSVAGELSVLLAIFHYSKFLDEFIMELRREGCGCVLSCVDIEIATRIDKQIDFAICLLGTDERVINIPQVQLDPLAPHDELMNVVTSNLEGESVRASDVAS